MIRLLLFCHAYLDYRDCRFTRRDAARRAWRYVAARAREGSI